MNQKLIVPRGGTMNQDELIEKHELTDEGMKLAAETSKILCEYLGEGYEQPAYDLTALMLLKVIPIIQKAEGIKTAPIICLCGSTRFTKEMLIKQWELTKQGNIVLGWCALPDDYFSGEDKTHIGDQEGVKHIVDEVHKRKINLCDEVFVLNIGGYIRESTASEIAYAKKLGKPIKYWQDLKGENDTTHIPRQL